MRIPIYCPVCQKFYPGPITILPGATAHFENVTSRCPLGHEAHFLDGTHSIQNRLLTVVQNRPEVLQAIQDLANQGLSGRIEPTTAINKITELVPEISPTIWEKFGDDRSIALLQLLVGIIACILAYMDLSKPVAPSQITNNYYGLIDPPVIEKQQAKKKDKRKAQRKARRVGRAVRRAK